MSNSVDAPSQGGPSQTCFGRCRQGVRSQAWQSGRLRSTNSSVSLWPYRLPCPPLSTWASHHCTLARYTLTGTKSWQGIHSQTNAPAYHGLLGTMASTAIAAPVLNYPLTGSTHWLSGATCTASCTTETLADNGDLTSADSATTFALVFERVVETRTCGLCLLVWGSTLRPLTEADFMCIYSFLGNSTRAISCVTLNA